MLTKLEPKRKQLTVLASAARAAAGNVYSAVLTSDECKGVLLIIDVTAVAATPSIVVTIYNQDRSATTVFASITSASAITAVGTYAYGCYPGGDGSPLINSVLLDEWFVEVAHADSDSITYSISAEMIP